MMGTYLKSYDAIADEKQANDELTVDMNESQSSGSRSRLIGLAAGLAMGCILYYSSTGTAVISSEIGSSEINLFGKGAENHSADEPLYYDNQLVDHFSASSTAKWSNRYFTSNEFFRGPGHPIFLIVGGEGAMESGMLYPFVTEHLAKQFHAFVLQIEHRFYGKSPVQDPTIQELQQLLTPNQAIADMLRLAKHMQTTLNCSLDRSSPEYCPIISVGGSYPGFLSAMMRLVYPDVVDISYASSAPLHLYSQSVDQGSYYEVVTQSAERASAGCAFAVKSALMDIVDDLAASTEFETSASNMGVCIDTIPDYIATTNIFSEEIMFIVATTFADYNMGNYPPTEKTDMVKACKAFQNDKLTSLEKVSAFLQIQIQDDAPSACFDMRMHLPDGPYSTISSADWSGTGPGHTGLMWDYQLCDRLVANVGFSEKSMFPYRKWTLEWLTEHCWKRFEVVPKPQQLVEEWRFEDLVANGGSRILFTNGMNDMWSAGSHLDDVSDSILTLNFPNGAHHSDLSHQGPTSEDTEDIKQGFLDIADILAEWLEEIEMKMVGEQR